MKVVTHSFINLSSYLIILRVYLKETDCYNKVKYLFYEFDINNNHHIFKPPTLPHYIYKIIIDYLLLNDIIYAKHENYILTNIALLKIL